MRVCPRFFVFGAGSDIVGIMNDKVPTQSADVVAEKITELRRVLPEVFSEDKLDFEKLRAFFDDGDALAQGGIGAEKYGLNWAGRGNAFLAIRTGATGTLVPRSDESVNFEATENVFIEGDNLEVLKLLQKHYREKIKMIYIDPPYNTGKDFVYKDNFSQSVADYYEQTGQTEGGIKMTANTEKNGRYHSDWLTMMYPRLFLAKNLLREDGVIFVSIDDNEVANLRLILDEIFGEENFVGDFIWHKKLTGGYDNKYINIQHEYILVYAKSKEAFETIPEVKESNYKLIDENGKKYKWDSLWNIGGLTYSKSLDYAITAPDGTEIWPIGEKGISFWLWSKAKVETEREKLKFEKDKNGKWKVYKRIYASDGLVPGSILDKDLVKGNTHSSAETKNMFGGDKIFDYAKPTPLIKYLVERGLPKDGIILDFFAGSGTTAHAVMDLNAEDGGNRKWICVQIPETTDETSEAYKAGYKNIAEISRERIRRAGKKIGKGDVGFKGFALSKSNYTEWNVLTDKDDEETLLKQSKLFIEQPLVKGYDEKSVVYEILVKEGCDLNAKVVKTDDLWTITDNGKKIVVTFAQKVTQEQVKALELSETDTFVCFDNALDDTTKVNIMRGVNLKVI